MKEVILEGVTKEINSARGSTKNPYGVKNKILQKWQTNFSWLNRNTLNYYLRKTRPPKNIQLASQAEVSDLAELLSYSGWRGVSVRREDFLHVPTERLLF